jgi:hypothetical protein
VIPSRAKSAKKAKELNRQTTSLNQEELGRMIPDSASAIILAHSIFPLNGLHPSGFPSRAAIVGK